VKTLSTNTLEHYQTERQPPDIVLVDADHVRTAECSALLHRHLSTTQYTQSLVNNNPHTHLQISQAKYASYDPILIPTGQFMSNMKFKV